MGVPSHQVMCDFSTPGSLAPSPGGAEWHRSEPPAPYRPGGLPELAPGEATGQLGAGQKGPPRRRWVVLRIMVAPHEGLPHVRMTSVAWRVDLTGGPEVSVSHSSCTGLRPGPDRLLLRWCGGPHLPGPLLLRHSPHVQLHRLQCPTYLATEEVRFPLGTGSLVLPDTRVPASRGER